MNIISRIEECFANPDNGAFALNRKDAEVIIRMLRAGDSLRSNLETLIIVTKTGLVAAPYVYASEKALYEFQTAKKSI